MSGETPARSVALQIDPAAAWKLRASPERLGSIIALSGLLILAFALRLIPVVFVPSLNWWDEIFQTTEPAHRLVFGVGLVPWEFQLGARSWILPGVFAGLMELSRVIGDGPDYYLPIIAGACDLLAMIPVVCCFLWCRRLFGLTGAIVGGLCVAVAPELVYFGARTLNEVVAAHLLVLALYLLEPGYRVTSRRRLFSAGAILALVFVLRVQIAPAIALIGLWSTIGAPWARFAAIAGGGLSVLAFVALLDALTLGYPFASIWRYVLYNGFYGVSSTFGVEPWYYYGLMELMIWLAGLFVLLPLVLLGARRTVLPFAAALVIIAVHSIIAHKEYRFIYPAVVLLAVEAGIGLAALVTSVPERLNDRGRWRSLARPAAAGALAGGWCLLSFLTWTGPAMAALRYRVHDYLAATSLVAHMAGICGIGLYGLDGKDWARYGGYSWLHQPVPMYWPKDGDELEATAASFDILLYTTDIHPAPPMPAGFVKERCFDEVCLARRAGKCDGAPMMPMPFPEPLAGLRPHR